MRIGTWGGYALYGDGYTSLHQYKEHDDLIKLGWKRIL